MFLHSMAPCSFRRPLFVTWDLADKHGEFHLRGCIGTFEAGPLFDLLPEYSLIRLKKKIQTETTST